MKLDKENTKQVLKIVIIAIVVLVALINIEPVWNVVKTTFSILSPFIWGLAIAFILNIFMTLYENKLFKIGSKGKKRKNVKRANKTEMESNSNESLKNNSKKTVKKSKLERGLSITLSIITIIAVITIILILIVPQFVEVIKNFVSNIPNYLGWLKVFAMDITEQYPEVNDLIQGIHIDTEALRTGIMNLSKNVLAN